jgi:hypothetical protein
VGRTLRARNYSRGLAEDCKRSQTRPPGPIGNKLLVIPVAGNKSILDCGAGFCERWPCLMLLAHPASALGPVFAENLLRHYSMPDGSKPATMVVIWP